MFPAASAASAPAFTAATTASCAALSNATGVACAAATACRLRGALGLDGLLDLVDQRPGIGWPCCASSRAC
jgi:hypothetical protein